MLAIDQLYTATVQLKWDDISCICKPRQIQYGNLIVGFFFIFKNAKCNGSLVWTQIPSILIRYLTNPPSHCSCALMIRPVVQPRNFQNAVISLKNIHFIDKIKLILYSNLYSTTHLTLMYTIKHNSESQKPSRKIGTAKFYWNFLGLCRDYGPKIYIF